MGNILTLEEARLFLGIDDNHANNVLIQSELDSIDSSLFFSTGVRWNQPPEGRNVEPIAKTVAKLMIYDIWFSSNKFDSKITYYIKQLQLKSYEDSKE